MARFPKIDSPCPLPPEAQARIAGHCGRCGKTVHALDGMDDAARAALVRNAGGSLCVSYRLKASLGAALALSISGPALAADGATPPTAADDAVPALQQPVAAAQAATPVPVGKPLELDGLKEIWVGGISNPADAEWLDDDDGSLPELPMVVEPPAQSS